MAKKKTGKVDDPATPEDESVVEDTETAELDAEAADLEAQAVAARAAADEAKAKKAERAAAAELAKVDPAKHVFLEGIGKVEFPADVDVDKAGRCRARALTIGGFNYEHVGDRTYSDAEGVTQNVWVYRRM